MNREYQFTTAEMEILNKFKIQYPDCKFSIDNENITFINPNYIRISILRIYEISDSEEEINFNCDFGNLTFLKKNNLTVFGTYDYTGRKPKHRRKTTVKTL